MYLIRVSEDTRIKLKLIMDALSFRDGKSKSYNDVILELLKFYEESSKKPR